ncbi:GalNAc(5)-diNAcBac-PP-undecaprenol beta-1,3-glucosyltransferase [compost metagenome]
MDKKITIYIPTKNRLGLLKKAIDSVIQQTYDNWELIVVNDGSTDGTKDFLDKLVSENSKIKAIHHIESQGACVSRNDAIFSATGEFITGLDDDDEFTTDRLAVFLENWSDEYIGLFSSWKFDEKEIPFDTKRISNLKQEDLLYGNFAGNQIFTRTKTLKSVGGFDSKFKMWQDFDCWYRVLSLGNLLFVNHPTYILDISDRDDRITNNKKEVIIDTYNMFVNKHKLSKNKATILKFHLAYYKIYTYNLKFAFSIYFNSNQNPKVLQKIMRDFFNPAVKSIWKKYILKK